MLQKGQSYHFFPGLCGLLHICDQFWGVGISKFVILNHLAKKIVLLLEPLIVNGRQWYKNGHIVVSANLEPGFQLLVLIRSGVSLSFPSRILWFRCNDHSNPCFL